MRSRKYAEFKKGRRRRAPGPFQKCDAAMQTETDPKGTGQVDELEGLIHENHRSMDKLTGEYLEIESIVHTKGSVVHVKNMGQG